MASVTVSGSINGFLVGFQTTSAVQQALVEHLLAASTIGISSQVVSGAGGQVSAAVVLNTSSDGSTLVGSANFPTEQVMMVGQHATFLTGGASVSTVLCADGSNSSVVNSNFFSSLLAVTGSGGNVLAGMTGANQFVTAVDGQDIVLMDGQSNRLESNGADAVLVGGPSIIATGEFGVDNVLMTTGTQLAFINGSRAGGVDTVTGAANGAVTVAGTGATLLVAGNGPEVFFVDTSAGSVTLNGSRSGSDTFEFVAGSSQSMGTIQVNDFVAGDIINLHGYSSPAVTSLVGGGGSMLVLSDGSHVTFSNVTAESLISILKSI